MRVIVAVLVSNAIAIFELLPATLPDRGQIVCRRLIFHARCAEKHQAGHHS